jgi:pimeloyl-ACP methyl ester carboxylesterase
MTWPQMQKAEINGLTLELWHRGSGEPVVFVHGSMGDECAAVLVEPALSTHFRVIHYHRRGYGNSQRPEAPVSMRQQAVDCRAVMQYLGVERAHLVGQSYGGAVLLQIALDFPDAVHSLSLLEPALPSVLGNSQAFTEMVGRVVALYNSEDRAGALATFGEEVAGADFRAVCDQTLPRGYFERWVADADTIFQSDLPALQQWQFTHEDADRITQPVLNLSGTNTTPYFKEIHQTVRTWLPDAEHSELADATHAMLQTNPKGAAERLVSFFSRHPMARQ